MKFYKYLLFLPLLASCEMEKEPNGLAGLWNSVENVQMALDAAYVPLYDEEAFGEGHWWVGPLSDDMIYNRTQPEEEPLSYFTTPTNGSSGLARNWKMMYQVIRRASDVMKNAPDVVTDPGTLNAMMGEANFLCGYSYFFLAKRYGGLPFFDVNNPEETNVPRSTKQETYERIEHYLQEAIRYFSDVNGAPLWHQADDDFGRPNLGAAYGLLAKVYAHWGKFEECRQAAEAVINSGEYSLDTTNGNGYAHLFSPAGEKSDEVLFNLNNTSTRHQGSIISVVPLSGTLSGGTGWYYFAPTRSLYEAFDEGDQRRRVTMRGNGETFDALGNTYMLATDPSNAPALAEGQILGDISDMQTGFMSTKYAAAYESLTGWNWEAGADVPLLRYADVLLLHAEAVMRLAGAGPDNRETGVAAAAESFNQVRVRAFGNDPSAAITAPTFNDLVKERRCELAYEDERHYDLVRWGMAQEVYGSMTTDLDPRGPRQFDPSTDAHIPLPQTEIDNSNGVLVNNPSAGYSDFGSAQ